MKTGMTMSKKKDKNKTPEKKFVVVDCISTHHMRYVVELNPNDPDDFALDTVVMGEAKEFSQNHIDENIVTHRVITDPKEMLALARKDNPYWSDWSDDKVMAACITDQTANSIEPRDQEKSDTKKKKLKR